MKDKRLDILLEHFIQEKECKHFTYTSVATGFCSRIMKDGMPKKIDCSGSIKACELEN